MNIDWQQFHEEVKRICDDFQGIAKQLRDIKARQLKHRVEQMEPDGCVSVGADQSIEILTLTRKETSLKKRFRSQILRLVKLHRAVYLVAEKHNLSPFPVVMSKDSCFDGIIWDACGLGIEPVLLSIVSPHPDFKDEDILPLGKRFLVRKEARKEAGR